MLSQTPKESIVKVPGGKGNKLASLQKNITEKDILLSLNTDIANVRDKKDILKLIHPKLKLLFDTDDIFICCLDPVNRTLAPILRVGGAKRTEHPGYEAIVNSSFPVWDRFIGLVLKSKEPLVFDIEALSKLSNATESVRLYKATGLAEALSVSLYNAGEVIGVLTLFSEIRNFFTGYHKRLVSEISNQISVVVTNILAADAIKKKDRHNEILLSISNEIACIRGKGDLLRIIRDTLRRYIHFDDSFILRYNEETKTCRSYIYHVGSGRSDKAEFEEQLNIDYPVDDNIEYPQIPIVRDVESLLSAGNKHVSFIARAGIAEFISIKLIERNRLIGLLVLLSEQKSLFKSDDLDLLQGLSYQISIATANIIANEEIASREEEKSILLRLSSEIAALKNRLDLLQVVNTKLKVLFSIKEFGIAHINEDGKTYSAFALDLENNIKLHADFNEVTSGTYRVNDVVFSSIMKSEDPITFNVNTLAEQPDMPAYVGFWKSAGLHYVLGTALRVGGQDIGCVFLHMDTSEALKVKKSLLKGVCAQLAVAVSNILANEKIQERREEKTRLLAFSNAMASDRDKEVLAKILRQQLKELFGIEDYVIHVLCKDKKTHRPILYDPDAGFARHPDFLKLVESDADVNDGVFNTILAADDVVTLDIEDLSASPVPPAYANAAKSVGVKKMAGVAIRVGQENIAVMNFRQDGISQIAFQRPLFKSICSQISIAVSNIIANDEIERREEEKSNLLAFSNAIASVREKDSFAQILKLQLRDFFAIENYVIYELSDDKKKYRPILYDVESEFAKHPDFIKTLNVYTDVNNGTFGDVLASTNPTEINLEQHDDPANPSISINKGAGGMIGVPIRLGQENIGLMIFKPIQSEKFETQKQLFKSICSQLAIAVFNFIANERINKQLSEIEKYRQQLEEEKIYLKEEIEATQNYSEIIGESAAIMKVFHMVTQVAHSDSTVLLLGETGTGKELIARAIHNSSKRKSKLMIKVNCAALPANLIESELFGHERGSFTGAIERRIGKFELANNGTLFLDEIGEMPMDLQVKLLRALQEKEIERVGGKTTIKTDARIIAATNRDLEKLMDEGKFRSDLYYRLNIFPITLPSLRNRREDIPQLATYFMKRFSKKAGKKINSIADKTLQELMEYNWPGNIRELEHLIERSVLLASENTIREIALPRQKKNLTSAIGTADTPISTLNDNEKEHILRTLKYANGRIGGIGGAAELLGVPTSTLNSKMKRLGIRKEHLG